MDAQTRPGCVTELYLRRHAWTSHENFVSVTGLNHKIRAYIYSPKYELAREAYEYNIMSTRTRDRIFLK